MYRGAESAPNATIDTENVALLDAGAFTKFVILQVRASCNPAVPEGSPAKDILSCLATASNVTESAGKLVGELTEQSAAGGCCCKDAANNSPDTVMDVMG